jgi:hypothetical protein
MIQPDLIKHLSDAQQTELREYEALFESPAWKKFQEAVEQRTEMHQQAALAANAWAENRLAMGRFLEAGLVMQFETRMINEIEATAIGNRELAEQAAEDAELDYE